MTDGISLWKVLLGECFINDGNLAGCVGVRLLERTSRDHRNFARVEITWTYGNKINPFLSGDASSERRLDFELGTIRSLPKKLFSNTPQIAHTHCPDPP